MVERYKYKCIDAYEEPERSQWNGCRVHDAASGLWSGSSITGGLRRGAVVCYRVVGSPEPQIR